MKGFAFACVIVALLGNTAVAQPVDTELAGVTAELLELRRDEGVLRLAVRFVNTTDAQVEADRAFLFEEVTLLDMKTRTRYLAIKAAGRFLAGPMSDDVSGGRWWIKLPPKADAILWMFFTAVPARSLMSVHVPRTSRFDNVTVSVSGPSPVFSSNSARSTPSGLAANLVSAMRMKTGQVRVRLRIERTGTFEPIEFLYKDFVFYEPVGRTIFMLAKDEAGLFLAQPRSDPGSGGRFSPKKVRPKSPATMNLTYGSIPETVKTVDLLMPWFVPITGVEIVQEGRAKR